MGPSITLGDMPSEKAGGSEIKLLSLSFYWGNGPYPSSVSNDTQQRTQIIAAHHEVGSFHRFGHKIYASYNVPIFWMLLSAFCDHFSAFVFPLTARREKIIWPQVGYMDKCCDKCQYPVFIYTWPLHLVTLMTLECFSWHEEIWPYKYTHESVSVSCSFFAYVCISFPLYMPPGKI